MAFVYPNYVSYHDWQPRRFVEEFAVKNRLRLLEFKLNQAGTYDCMPSFAQQEENQRDILMPPNPDSLALGTVSAGDITSWHQRRTGTPWTYVAGDLLEQPHEHSLWSRLNAAVRVHFASAHQVRLTLK